MLVRFLHYWAGLQKPEDKMIMEDGAAVLQQNAVVLHPHNAGSDHGEDNCLVPV